MQPLKPEDIKYLIVHHTATPRDSTTFEAVKRYHTQELGWEDIGYHFFINGQGILNLGRPVNYVGSHCSAGSMNFKSLGICLAGNFEVEKPSEGQLKMLESILRELMNKYKIPIDNLLGHCEVPGAKTLCPGKNLLEWLKNYREQQKRSSDIANILQAIQETLARLQDLVSSLKSRL
jgi:N-acetyl-anhydromuramyl-L-alanine amidase AmpD